MPEWKNVDEVADGIAEVLGIDPELIGITRAGRYGSAQVVLTEAQARRLTVLAIKGKEQSSG